jgi:lipopolysaccharide export system ATP-binding protein
MKNNLQTLKIEHIRKSYGSKPVIRDISLSIPQGSITGLLGPNGAGKTTSFYIISGMIAADSGKIFLGEDEITKLPMFSRARLGIGYLPQESSIFRGLNVEENIMSILEYTEDRHSEREAILDKLLAEFSISHLRNSPALSLSGGERRRVEIARCLAAKPKFIMLDEPLAGVDPIAVNEIKELIHNLKKRGIGVIITDHNVRETLDIIDYGYIIHEGTVLMSGTAEEIVNDEMVRKIYLGENFTTN